MICDVVGGTGARMIKKKRNERKMNFKKRKNGLKMEMKGTWSEYKLCGGG